MAQRVEISGQGWGWVADVAGNGQAGVTVQIKNTDGSNATHYSAITGGTSATSSLTTSSDGTIPRFIAEGSYDLTAGGVTRRVEAVAGATVVLAESRVATLGPTIYKPGGLRRWRAALGDALLAQPSILAFGHSIVQGVGSDNAGAAVESASYIAGAWPRQLAKLFAGVYGDAGEGFIHPGDYRWSFGGTTTTRDDFAPLRRARQMAASSGTATITLPLGTTEFDVHFFDGNVQFSVAIDGGGATTYTPGNLGIPGKRTITGLSAGSAHTIVIANVGGANFYLSGITVRKQTTGVLVHRAGIAGADVGYATGFYNTGFVNGSVYVPLATGVQNNLMDWTFGLVGQTLTIAEFATNDYGQQSTSGITPANYATGMQRFIDEATVERSGCVLILHGPSSVAAVNTYTEQQYWDAAKALADTNDHVAVVNIADLWGTQAQAQTDGLSITSSVHPNRKGHGDIARVLHRVLTAPGLAN